jgi:hypothetical protein
MIEKVVRKANLQDFSEIKENLANRLKQMNEGIIAIQL